MKPSLSTTALTKRYVRTTAVDDATLTLTPGRIYGLLGPNGSGKSTLMKLAAGLVQPTSGEIRIMDEPIGAHTRAHVAFMPTEPYFYGYMTVRQVGGFHADFYSDFCSNTFARLIQSMGLQMDMKVSSLSSGMAAKLKLAAATARDARLIMLDEPLNGIDIIARDLVISTVIEKANENNTILLSSHLIDVMENILDDVIFIKEGRIVLQGEAEAVREKHGKSIVDLYREVFAS
jgi:ABC-2 type transport system ATP-binding protein